MSSESSIESKALRLIMSTETFLLLGAGLVFNMFTFGDPIAPFGWLTRSICNSTTRSIWDLANLLSG